MKKKDVMSGNKERRNDQKWAKCWFIKVKE